ncbi:MAG: hypothetical protein J6Q75_01705, partial [Bacteroidaceae bacterium]|nr:hypothetical protein [Bacteroidaceae bacterium]
FKESIRYPHSSYLYEWYHSYDREQYPGEGYHHKAISTGKVFMGVIIYFVFPFLDAYAYSSNGKAYYGT